MRPATVLATVAAVLVAAASVATVWPASPPDPPTPAARARDVPVRLATLVCPPPPGAASDRAYPPGENPATGSEVRQLVAVGGSGSGWTRPAPPARPGESASPTSDRLTVTALAGAGPNLPSTPAGPVVAPVPADAGPLVVTVRGSLAPGATAMVHAREERGFSRGLASSPCLSPRADWWFVSPGTRIGQQPVLVLVNPAASPAEVNLTLIGPHGPVRSSAATGIVLPPQGHTQVPLDALAPDLDALAVHVTVRGGQVGAALSVVETDGLDPRGMDWVSPAAPPARRQVIPLVPGGAGPRLLHVAAPADQEAVVAVRVLGRDGGYAPVGRESLTVPAGSVASLDVAGLAPSASADPIGLQLTADVPIVAAALTRIGGADGSGELAWSPSSPPLLGPALLTLARAGAGTRTQIVLAAPAGPARVQVSIRYPGARRAERALTVPAGTAAVVPLAPPADVATYQVRLRPLTGAPLHAAALVTEATPGPDMITVVPLRAAPRTVHLPLVVRDLRVASP